MNAKPFLAAAASLTLATAPAAANQWIYDSSARTLSWTDSSGFENKIENVTVVSGTQNKLQVGNNKSNANAVNLDFSPGIADGYELHRFETGAFLGNNSVTNLVCPPSLRIIGWASFESTKNLVWVDLNEGLTTFDSQRSFYESGVHAISRIPSTLTSLGVNTFRGTTSLTNDIVWPDTVESYPQMFFYGSGIGSFTARKGLKTIGTYALGKNNHLTNVVLSMDLKSIGSSMLSEITKAQFHCDVWWRNFPEGGFSSMWANGDFAQYAITNHFEWNSRGKWAEFAATNSGWNLTLPPTFDGVGDLYVNYRHHVVLWWKDPDQRGSPTVVIVK